MHEYRSPALKRLNCLLSEMDAAYHEAAQRQGQNDSTSRILYALCELGSPASLRAVCESTGLSKQTVNSALRRMEGDGLIYLESAGRGKDVCLTPEGEALVQRTARRVIQAENQVFAAWPQEDVEQYLALTRRFQEALAQKAREIKEES